MSFFTSITENLKNILGQANAANTPEGLSKLLAQTPFGSLEGLVGHLQAGGLADQVRSWLGSGANLPVSAEQLRSALGDEQVRQFAGKLGIPADAALSLLSKYLPTAVDQASPNGTIEPSQDPAQVQQEQQQH